MATATKIHDALKTGKSFDQISQTLNLTKPRITELLKLAFLAPSIVELILKGEQPLELTTDRILNSSISTD